MYGVYHFADSHSQLAAVGSTIDHSYNYLCL